MEQRHGIGGWVRATVLTILVVIGLPVLALTYVLVHPAALVSTAAHLTERFLGRSLAIDGEVTLDLSLEPRISARDVRFGNAAWSDEPYMARAGYVLVQIDLRALFNRRVHLLDLDVEDAELLLEDPADGSPNWRFFDGGDRPGDAWSFMLEGLRVERSVVRARLGDLQPIELEIPSLVERTDEDGNLVVDGNGRLNGDPWQVRGQIGTFDELLAAGRIELDVDAVVEDVSVKAAGSIGNLETLSGLNLTLEVQGRDADVLGSIFQMPEAFAGDVSLDAAIRPTAEGQVVEVKGHVSRFEVDLTGTIGDLQRFDAWDATVEFSGPDAALFGKALQLDGLPGGPFQVSGEVHRHGGNLDFKAVSVSVADARLTLNADFADFPRRAGAVASLSLSGSDLGRYRKLLRLEALPEDTPYELDAALDATGNPMLTLSFRAGSHRLTAAGPVGEYPDYSGTRLNVTLTGTEIAELTRLARLPDTVTGPYNARSIMAIDDGGISASKTTIGVEPFRLEGELMLPDVRELGQLVVDGRLRVSDLALAGELLAVSGLPAVPLEVRGRLSSDGSAWQLERGTGQLKDLNFDVSGTLGDLRSVAGIDLAVALEGRNVDFLLDDALPGKAGIPFTASSRIRGIGNALEVQDFVLTAEGGELRANGRWTFAESYVGSHVSLQGHGQDLARTLPEFRGYAPPHEAWEVSGTLRLPSAGRVEVETGNLHVGSVQVSVAGVLDVQDQERTSLSLSLGGDSLTDLGQLRDIELPALPFSISLALEGSPSMIRVPRFEAHWGESDLLAEGSVDISGKPEFVLKGASSVLRIDDLQQALFGDLDEETSGTGRRFFPDTPIPLDVLNQHHWDVSVAVDDFQGRRIRLHDVDLVFTISDGALTIDRVQYRDERGAFKATGMVRASDRQPSAAHLTLHVQGEDADLGLFTSPDQPPETIPRYDLDISIDGQGTTVAELAGSVNGSLLVSSNGGRISNTLLKNYAGDFLSNVLDVLNPFAKSEPFTPVQCLVLNAVIEDGKLDLVPGFVMRTNQLNMFVLGNVNLKTEKLNLSLATQARRGIGISAATITNPYFRIGGTLTAPSLQLDAESAAVAAGVAAATAGLSIVVRGVWSRLMGEQDPCPQFLNYQRKEKDGDRES